MPSNVLDYSTPDELRHAIGSYNNHMAEIPEEFPVLHEYLNGLTNKEFCAAFRELRDVVVALYDGLLKQPEIIGLLNYDKKSDAMEVQTSQSISSIKKLLYTLGLVSELRNGSLDVDMGFFREAYRTFYPNCSAALSDELKPIATDRFDVFYRSKHVGSVLKCLTGVGFVLEGFAEDREFSELEQLRVRFPENPRVMSVLRAFSMPRICRVSFGFDYAKFNYRVFAHGTDARLPMEELHSVCLLPEQQRAFLLLLNSELEQRKIGYGESERGWYHGTLPCQYIYRNKLRILQNMENGIMPHLVLRLSKKVDRLAASRGIDKAAALIEYVPAELHSHIPKCIGCRKECDVRATLETDGRRRSLCHNHGRWWAFPPVNASIELLLEGLSL